MRLPLVLYQAGRRHDVGVGLGIGRAGRITAMLWIVAVRILRPQSVHHKAQVAPALRAVTVGRAELRRPGKVQQVEIELRPAPPAPADVRGAAGACCSSFPA